MKIKKFVTLNDRNRTKAIKFTIITEMDTIVSGLRPTFSMSFMHTNNVKNSAKPVLRIAY